MLKRILHPVLVALALLLVLEEFLWDWSQRALHRVAALLHLHKLEGWLRRLPPWASLLVLLLPGLVLLPFKLLAVYALAQGHPVVGVLTLVGAKLAGTAAAAYLFDLVRDSARRLAWVDWAYLKTVAGIAAAKAWLNKQPSVVAARELVARWKLRMKQALSASSGPASGRWASKWRAARKLVRSKGR